MRPNTKLLDHIEKNRFTHFFCPRSGSLFLLRPAQHPSYPGCWAEQVVMRRQGEEWFVEGDILIWGGDDLSDKKEKVRPLDPQGRGWWTILNPLTPAERMDRIELYHRRGFITDWQLWDVLGHLGGPLSGAEAIQVYQRLGYKPLAGYPLQKERTVTNCYHPLSRPIKSLSEREQVSQKPDGLWRCQACRNVWHGHQLRLDPLQTATTWTCAELSCGGGVVQLPRTDRDLPAGQYLYTRPSWDEKVPVTIEEGPKKEKLVLFDDDSNYYPVDLRDIPADAKFWPIQVTYKGVYCEYSRYHDQTAIVVRELTPEEIGDTEEVGRMWRIRFADDVEINVFPEEIFPDGVMAQLEESDNSATEELMKIVEGKQYRRISSGEILSGAQVLFQLSQIANPQLKAILLADVEEIGK